MGTTTATPPGDGTAVGIEIEAVRSCAAPEKANEIERVPCEWASQLRGDGLISHSFQSRVHDFLEVRHSSERSQLLKCFAVADEILLPVPADHVAAGILKVEDILIRSEERRV